MSNHPPSNVATTHQIVIDTLGRPPTANKHRSKHWRVAAADTKAWRHLAAIYWRQEGGALKRIAAERLSEERRECHFTFTRWECQPFYTGGRIPDVGACHPAIKAVIDGAIDAGLLKDDSPPHVDRITYLTPLVDSSHESCGLRVSFTGTLTEIINA